MQSIAEILKGDTWITQSRPVSERQARQPARATLHDLDVTHPKLAAAVEMCRRWKARKAEWPEASVIMTGPYGTGKTHIARAILWSICLVDDDGEPVCPAGRFYTSTDLMMRLSPTQNEYGVIETPRTSTLLGASPIVVIDDVGAEQRLPFVAAADQSAELEARYFRVIDYCYTSGVSVVITSNLTITALAQHIGGRSWDRLSEMAPRGFAADLTGVPSWRQAQSGR